MVRPTICTEHLQLLLVFVNWTVLFSTVLPNTVRSDQWRPVSQHQQQQQWLWTGLTAVQTLDSVSVAQFSCFSLVTFTVSCRPTNILGAGHAAHAVLRQHHLDNVSAGNVKHCIQQDMLLDNRHILHPSHTHTQSTLHTLRPTHTPPRQCQCRERQTLRPAGYAPRQQTHTPPLTHTHSRHYTHTTPTMLRLRPAQCQW